MEGVVKPSPSGSNLNAMQNAVDPIDWDKVGRLYKPESAVQHIVSQEIKRLENGFNQNIENQDVQNEEKFKAKKK